jgi:SAM-dependent methyltransferase
MTSLQDLILSLVDAGSREHYEDAELYDYEYRRRREDVAFYRRLAQRLAGGRDIVDLGAGTGRLTLPLARDGHRVTAVDQAPTMLDGLERRLARAPAAVAARVTARPGDLRTFALGQRFGLALAAFNVVEHLYTRVELAAFLARVAAHLEPGGHLAFDVQMPDLRWLTRDPQRRWARTRFTHPGNGRQFIYSTNHDYDPVTQIALIRLYYEPVEGGPTRVVKLSQRKFFPAELEALVAASGFRLVERYGDFEGAELDGLAMSQVLVCQLDAAPAPSSRRAAAPIARPSRPRRPASPVTGPLRPSRPAAASAPSSRRSAAPVGAPARVRSAGSEPGSRRASAKKKTVSDEKKTRPRRG